MTIRWELENERIWGEITDDLFISAITLAFTLGIALLYENILIRFRCLRQLLNYFKQGSISTRRLEDIRICLHATQICLSIISICTWFFLAVSSAPLWLRHIEIISLIFYMIHFLLRVRERNGTLFISLLYPLNVIDIIAICAGWNWALGQSTMSLHFLRMVQVISSADIVGRVVAIKMDLSPVTTQIVLLLVRAICMILLMACAIYLVENLGDPPSMIYAERDSDRWSMWTSIYFVFVTLSTVGYGDISCSTLLGRALIVVFIVFGIIIFTNYVSAIVQALEQQRQGLNSFTPYYGERFFILCGMPSFNEVKVLLNIMFHEDLVADPSKAVSKIVLLSPRVLEPDFQTQIDQLLLKRPEFQSRIVLIAGSPLSYHDLIRASAKDASGCIVIADSLSKDTEFDDTSNILRALAFGEVHPQLNDKVYILLKHAAVLGFLPALGFPIENCISTQFTMNSAMGLTTKIPGFCTLLYGLCNPFKYVREKNVSSSWRPDYLRGLAQELYVVALKPEFTKPDSTFDELCENAYENLDQMIVLGVSIRGHAYLAPFGYSFASLEKISTKLTMRNPKGHWSDDNRILAVIIADDSQETKRLGDRVFDDVVFDDFDEDLSIGMLDDSESIQEMEVSDLMQRGNTKFFDFTSHDTMKNSFRHVRNQSSSTVPYVPQGKSQFLNSMEFDEIVQIRDELQDHIVILCSEPLLLDRLLYKIRGYEDTVQSYFNHYDRIEGMKTETSQIAVIYKGTESEFNDINYNGVLMISGDAMKDAVLRAARIWKARAILIAGREHVSQSSATSKEADLADVENVFLCMKIQDYLKRKRCEHVAIVTVLDVESNFRFFKYGSMTKNIFALDDEEFVPNQTALFASGQIVSNRLSRLLLNATVHNKGLMLFVNQLLLPGRRYIEHIDKVISGGFIVFASVPEGITSFGDLFREFTSSGKGVPIGLYRNANHTSCKCKLCALLQGNDPLPYVFTAPQPSTLLCQLDKVYVLVSTHVHDRESSRLDEIREDVKLHPDMTEEEDSHDDREYSGDAGLGPSNEVVSIELI